MKQKITEEMKLHEEWYNKSNEQTLETLPDFLNHLANDYEHDYGTICHAIACAALSAAKAMNKSEQGGISGFQAGAVMWEFIGNWMRKRNNPLMLVDYEDLLYPQYENKFSKTISKETFEWLKYKAQFLMNQYLIENSSLQNPCDNPVYKHWQEIAKGNLPFGFEVEID